MTTKHTHARRTVNAAAPLRIIDVRVPATVGVYPIKYPGGRFAGLHFDGAYFHASFLAEPKGTGECTFTVADTATAVSADAGGFLGSAVVGGRRVFVFATCVS